MGKKFSSLKLITNTIRIAIIGTPKLPKIKNGLKTFPFIKNPSGKAKSITARNLYEIKFAILESEKPFEDKNIFSIRKKAPPTN
tara:strand:+ start:4368 stop:4619 length:252 start_codon:yes stop_codon:yes gene_type:complete